MIEVRVDNIGDSLQKRLTRVETLVHRRSVAHELEMVNAWM